MRYNNAIFRSYCNFHTFSIGLDTVATRVAVAYQDACNPVLQAATKSFMTIARR